MSHSTTINSVPIRSIAALRKAVKELVAQGISLELEENATPRMYFVDQMQKHFKQPSEICPAVVRVNEAYYDVAFIPDPDNPGALKAAFDDYNGRPTYQAQQAHRKLGLAVGKGPIRDRIGARFDGKIQHWNNYKREDEQMRCTVGKLMQAYTKHATIEAAQRDGLRFVKQTVNKDTEEIQLEFVKA